MDRLVLLTLIIVLQVGCQIPLGGQSTRVPPPPTGAIGNGGDYYNPSPNPGTYYAPPPNSGAYYSAPRYPSEEVSSFDRTSQYWESPVDRRAATAMGRSQIANARNVASRGTNLTSQSPSPGLKRSDRLDWQVPRTQSYAEFAESTAPVPAYEFESTPVGSGYPPRQLEPVGQAAPLVSAPVRVRLDDPHRRQVTIPPELAEFSTAGVRQASATSQARYDDIRR